MRDRGREASGVLRDRPVAYLEEIIAPIATPNTCVRIAIIRALGAVPGVTFGVFLGRAAALGFCVPVVTPL
jgi:hypothetical protein